MSQAGRSWEPQVHSSTASCSFSAVSFRTSRRHSPWSRFRFPRHVPPLCHSRRDRPHLRICPERDRTAKVASGSNTTKIGENRLVTAVFSDFYITDRTPGNQQIVPLYRFSIGKTKSQFLPHTMFPHSIRNFLNFFSEIYELYCGWGLRSMYAPIFTTRCNPSEKVNFTDNGAIYVASTMVIISFW